MAIDLYLSQGGDDRYVVTLSEPLLDWFDRARFPLRVSSPFGQFEQYGTVTLQASTGELAAFASGLQRVLDALEAIDSAELPPLPVSADERDPELGELDRAAIVQLVRDALTAARGAESEDGSIVAKGE